MSPPVSTVDRAQIIRRSGVPHVHRDAGDMPSQTSNYLGSFARTTTRTPVLLVGGQWLSSSSSRRGAPQKIFFVFLGVAPLRGAVARPSSRRRLVRSSARRVVMSSDREWPRVAECSSGRVIKLSTCWLVRSSARRLVRSSPRVVMSSDRECSSGRVIKLSTCWRVRSSARRQLVGSSCRHVASGRVFEWSSDQVINLLARPLVVSSCRHVK